MKQFWKVLFLGLMLLVWYPLKAEEGFSPGFFNPQNPKSDFKFYGGEITEFNQINLKHPVILPTGGGEYGAGMEAGFISLAVPGLGLYRATGNARLLVFLPVCYGLVGYGTFKMLKGRSEAKEAYENYMIEKSPALQDEYLIAADDAKERYQTGTKILTGGIAIWLGQAAWAFIYGRYNDMYRARDAKWNNKVSFFPHGGYDFRTNTTTLNLSIKF